jgi:hypothetical protein
MLRPDIESAVRRVAEGMVSPRANKPPDKYSPHDGPTRWAVIGDSVRYYVVQVACEV